MAVARDRRRLLPEAGRGHERRGFAVDAGPKGAVVSFHKNEFPNPAALIDFITAQAGRVTLRPDHKLVYHADWPDPAARLQRMRALMRKLAALATDGRASAAE